MSVCVCVRALKPSIFIYLVLMLSSVLPKVCQRVTHIIQHHTLALPLQRRTGTRINTRVCHTVLSTPPLSFPLLGTNISFWTFHSVRRLDCAFIWGFTKHNSYLRAKSYLANKEKKKKPCFEYSYFAHRSEQEKNAWENVWESRYEWIRSNPAKVPSHDWHSIERQTKD